MSGAIHQEITFKANPQRVYDALMKDNEFSRWSGGAPAKITDEAGGEFSCFGGMITGRHVELKKGQRIVQAWRAGNWPDGVYSIARFDLAPQGSGTKLTFEHTGFPSEMREHLEGGWHKLYWEPLQSHLA